MFQIAFSRLSADTAHRKPSFMGRLFYFIKLKINLDFYKIKVYN